MGEDKLNKTVHLVPNYYEIFVNKQPIVLCHYAILSWNGMSHGSWHIFGHSHNSLKETNWVNNNYLNGKCLDVGVESCESPMSFNELKIVMDNKPIVFSDHHSKNTSTPFN